MKIEIQYFDGCPNSEKMLKNVKESITEIGKQTTEIQFVETLVANNDVAKKVKFRGSPTLIINGEDFEGMPIPDKPAMMCRYYPNGMPSKKMISNRINNFLAE